MEAKIIQFVVRDNNNFFSLELAKALLHFVEFDFTYFWEKCIEAGRLAKKSGRLPPTNVSNAKNIIRGIHPYVEAMIGDDFADIVTDCIIEYICHSERIGLEELWVRCISPKNLYEEAIFRRISQYKTGAAMNQWSNLVKLQEYARNKISFIYDCDEEKVPLEYEILHTRKEYFDLAVAMAANELGIDGRKMPSVRVGSSALMPNATFMNARVSKAIYRRFADVLEMAGDMSVPPSRDCVKVKDQLAMDSYAFVRGMKRPAEMDMKFALEALKDNSDEVFMPDSLKAVIDLEFDLMMKYNIVLRKCESCGRYFVAKDEAFLCDKVNSSGVTCRKQYDEMKAAIEAAAAAVRAEEEAQRRAAEAEEAAARAVSEPPVVKKGMNVPPELEKRGQKIYNALYKRVGKAMDENEFREWSRYLSDMKRNIKIGEATIEQLEDFLDYSDRLCAQVKTASKNKTHVKTSVENYTFETVNDKGDPIISGQVKERIEAFVPVSFGEDMPQEEIAEKKSEPVKVVAADEVEVKPFKPETFDSLFDAFMADHGRNYDEEETAEKTPQKPVEIKAPQWKRMTREEAYGLKEDDE